MSADNSERDKLALLEAGMTYVEKLDFRAQEHRHAMELLQVQEAAGVKRAKYAAAKERQGTVKDIGLALAAVLALAVALYAITYWTMLGPEEAGPSKEERREISCVESGGGWVPESSLATGDGLCVFPGKND